METPPPPPTAADVHDHQCKLERSLNCILEHCRDAKDGIELEGRILHIERQAREAKSSFDWLDSFTVLSAPADTVVTCVYCGHQYPDGTPTHKAELLTEHIKVCEKHPLRQAEETIAALRRREVIEKVAPPRLLHVTYGEDEALLDTTTGELLACVHRPPLFSPSSIARVEFTDGEAAALFGEEHCWEDLIGHIQANYDQEGKKIR